MIPFSKPTVEQFFRTYTITNFAVNNDETKLIFNTNLNGKMNLWALDLPDSFPYLFAHRDESCNFIKFDPENRYVLAGFDSDGDENFQIYSIPFEGGLPQPLITGGSDEKFYFSHLSDDGERIYYVTSLDNPMYFNTHMRNLESGVDTLLNIGEISPTQLAAVSDDEEKFVFSRAFANTYVISFVKIGEDTFNLTPDASKVHVAGDPVFTDDNTIYFVTDFESDFTYIAKFDLMTKSFSKVLEVEGESVQTIKFNKDNGEFYFITSKGVGDKLYRFYLENGKLEESTLPVDVIDQMRFAKSGNLYILGRSATVPHNIFKSTDGQTWEQLTENRVLGVSQEGMVEPDIVSYKSFDGLEIEALLFKAKEETANGYTIFWPHGGPQSSERKMFRSMFQCFLNRGYTIFAPNFRGSTGYGSEFTKMVEQDWGEGPRLDCLAGIEWLFDNGITDRDRLFLVGGSYGGYMALLLHGRHAEYFKAVVDIFGVSDLFTFVNSVPPHWKPIMERWLGDPERDKERFIKDSPVTYLDGMVKPMLVIQGAKDPRVVKEESDQIVAKLTELGRDVEYLVLDDEGHGFSKKENEIKVYSQMLEFLEKHQN
ncbi:alpha/beta hydrolase family protein [Saccharococcus sp. Marseille-Q5394]|uniref:S9 family peptidase n=1 Tax=Saccharococcus sp. Marseille-Q5394 TaxID=2972778 RepID=UPI0021C7735A|nr:S9 family peptidase [Saccharococcus sp. Marseille-Q5394]